MPNVRYHETAYRRATDRLPPPSARAQVVRRASGGSYTTSPLAAHQESIATRCRQWQNNILANWHSTSEDAHVILPVPALTMKSMNTSSLAAGSADTTMPIAAPTAAAPPAPPA